MQASVSTASYDQVDNQIIDDGDRSGHSYTEKEYERSVSPISEDSRTSHHVEPSLRVMSHIQTPSSTQHLVAPSLPEENSQHQELEEEPASEIRRPARHKIEFSSWWWLEIAALLLSLACIVTLLVVFTVYNKKPLDEWQRLIKVQPNTFASILVTIAKEALAVPVAQCVSQLKWNYFEEGPRTLEKLDVFDKASRGFLGGAPFLLELWKWPYRDGRGKQSALLATIGVTVAIAALAVDPFTQRSISIPLRLVSMGPNSASLPSTHIYDPGNDDDVISDNAGMNGAIFNGLFDLNIAVPYTFPTGSCTWPSFTSLGMCSFCQDVTSNSKSQCQISKSRSPNICQWTTPGGIQFSTVKPTEGNGEKTLVKVVPEPDGAGGINGIRLAAFLLPPGSERQPIYPTPSINECSLTWCGKVYADVTASSGELVADSTQALPLSFNPGSDPELMSYVAPADFPGNKDFLMRDTSRRVTEASLLAGLKIELSGIEGSLLVSSSSPSNFMAFQIYKSNNISTTLIHVATSMTEYLRTGRNSTQTYGEAWGEEEYILIDMPWLLLPLILIFLTFILLFSSIALNHSRNSELWKSSSLPFLYHGLEGWNKEVLAGLDTLETIEDEAKSMQAILQRNDENEIMFVRA